MEIRDEEYYEMMYTFRSAMCTLYGLSDKAVLSEDTEVKNGFLKEMKEKISQYSNMMEKYSPECDIVNIACVEHIMMKDTRALVIDDNEISNYLMVKMLEQLGVSADVAESGYEGIKAWVKMIMSLYLLIILCRTWMVWRRWRESGRLTMGKRG